jgi:hypothetical protein
MKKAFLGLLAAGMILVACNQTKTGGNTTADSVDTFTPPADSLAAAQASTTPVDTANAPVLKFEVESYDFGKIIQGEIVNYEFKFANTGKSPLVISNATASCGCTVPEWPKKPVLPGESGVIKVTFNSEAKSGLQDKLITITGNTVPAQTLVHLVGEVIVKK